ncbi:MAG: cell division protein ZapA [Prevotellaceae bacterium]|jgi:cell division protein ZapA (FtsZ GTPase activity inhibitor)|nr:cell division protein ZapA [Prevotellaceae bacterium]
MDQVSANIEVAGRIYRLRINAENEEYLRKAENLIKVEISRLNVEYHNRDTQDKLSIILLNIAARLIECQELSEVHCREIEKIDRELGIYLERQGSLDNIE